MRRASRAFASLFDKGRGLMVPRGNGGQVRVLTLVAMCIHCVCCFGVAFAYYRCTTVLIAHGFPKLRTVSTKQRCFVMSACICCCIRL
jgi:hypothetical protein